MVKFRGFFLLSNTAYLNQILKDCDVIPTNFAMIIQRNTSKKEQPYSEKLAK